jgi:hypothetical protein
MAVFRTTQQIAFPCVDAPFDARDFFNGLNM